jgi:hypothetical protein
MAQVYKIHPSVGIARVGDSEQEFFIGPEMPGRAPVELGAGGEQPVTSFKDGNFRVKRQAARFRIFVYDEDGGGNLTNPREITADDAEITWTVELANRKAAARESPPPLQTRPPRNPQQPDRARLEINPSSRSVSGRNQQGPAFDDGRFEDVPVYLGELRTDSAGRLLVLGGRGRSRSVPANQPISDFANNDFWHDDVSDGTVRATVRVAGQPPVEVSPENSSWVIVAPPDFAPALGGIVTLYDIMQQAAVERNWVQPPAVPSFRNDILPILERAAGLRWVHDWAYWSGIPRDWAALSDPANPSDVRETVLGLIENNPLNGVTLTPTQKATMDAWVAGNFVNDFGQAPVPAAITPDGLDSAPLLASVGAGFFPGIEAGQLTADKAIYSAPLRLNHGVLRPGSLSERMAVPWQADFTACRLDWWPSQRPDIAQLNPEDPFPTEDWAAGIHRYEDMVFNFSRLGYILRRQNSTGAEVFVEEGRDPFFPRT